MLSINKKGSVVIYVLFLITVITAVLIKYSKEIRLKAMISENLYTREIKIYELKNLSLILGNSFITGEDESIKSLGEKKQEVVYKNENYEVFIVKETELEDINTPDRTKITQKLYKIFGEASVEKVESLTDHILDFTDRDEMVREKGGENEAYTFEGLPFNRNFSYPDEIKLVKNIEDKDFFFVRTDNDTIYDGIFARFTTWKNSATVYNPQSGKYDVYKGVVRVYIKTPGDKVYVFFVGTRGAVAETFYWLRLR